MTIIYLFLIVCGKNRNSIGLFVTCVGICLPRKTECGHLTAAIKSLQKFSKKLKLPDTPYCQHLDIISTKMVGNFRGNLIYFGIALDYILWFGSCSFREGCAFSWWFLLWKCRNIRWENIWQIWNYSQNWIIRLKTDSGNVYDTKVLKYNTTTPTVYQGKKTKMFCFWALCILI